jgi:metal-sulfur cluster biosynthetic enzyme
MSTTNTTTTETPETTGIAEDVGNDEVDIGPGPDATEFERDLWAALDTVPDPHIPVSLVKMAMIYDVDVADDGHVTVTMTYPCMGCPAYEFIQDDVRGCLRVMEGVSDVTVEVTWEPVWSKDMLTAEAREELRDAGIGL